MLRFRLRVEEVSAEGPTVTSIRIGGRRLDRLGARPGQFFLWRFLTRGYWWTAHPFSLSAAPDGRSLRISVKAAGDHTARIGSIPVGTRVVAEGPFGRFTERPRQAREEPAPVAGGIGITPDPRARRDDGGRPCRDPPRAQRDATSSSGEELAGSPPAATSSCTTSSATTATRRAATCSRPTHLRELVPDIAEREVYLCGPPGMVRWMLANIRRAGVSRRRLNVERFAL